jgi:transcriptional regulator with XRE-family HTH domain
MARPSIQISFGTRARTLREARGFSQEAFAAKANLDRGAYGKLERGEVNVGLVTMARIAVALGISLSELVHGFELDRDEINSIPRSRRGPEPIGGRD